MADISKHSLDPHPTSPSTTDTRRHKPHRRRARRACLACRARKVRCDVVERVPCGNCKWDGTECVVANRRCGKYASPYSTKWDATDAADVRSRYVRVGSPEQSSQVTKNDHDHHQDLNMEEVGNHLQPSQSPEFTVPRTAPTEHYGINEDLTYTGKYSVA